LILWNTMCITAEFRSDNFIIGLTNVSTQQQPPVLYNYTACGQYPGAVPAGATVSLRCNDIDLPPARYVIVQFPMTEHFNFCELDVCAYGIADLALNCAMLRRVRLCQSMSSVCLSVCDVQVP